MSDNVREIEVRCMMAAIDTDNTGSVDFEEFAVMATKMRLLGGRQEPSHGDAPPPTGFWASAMQTFSWRGGDPHESGTKARRSSRSARRGSRRQSGVKHARRQRRLTREDFAEMKASRLDQQRVSAPPGRRPPARPRRGVGCGRRCQRLRTCAAPRDRFSACPGRPF